MVSIKADCCGAGGSYNRLVKKIDDGSLKLENISAVFIKASAQYWQVSYAGEQGGLFSKMWSEDSFFIDKEDF